MGNSLSAIRDDEEDYVFYCQHYGVKPELEYNQMLGGYQTNIYGEHSRMLNDAFYSRLSRAEFQDKWNNLVAAKKKAEEERQIKISAAKAKLTQEEISLLEIKV